MSNSEDISTRRQIDEICNEFEQQWSADERSDFGSFLTRIDESHRHILLKLLLEVEIELRRKAGQPIAADDYRYLGDEAVSLVEELLSSSPAESPTLENNTRSFDAAATKQSETRNNNFWGRYVASSRLQIHSGDDRRR